MPEYHFTGTVTLHGVDFYVDADSAEDARKKARTGAHEAREYANGEAKNWTIDEATCRLNE